MEPTRLQINYLNGQKANLYRYSKKGTWNSFASSQQEQTLQGNNNRQAITNRQQTTTWNRQTTTWNRQATKMTRKRKAKVQGAEDQMVEVQSKGTALQGHL
jgi:hypothetical protein